VANPVSLASAAAELEVGVSTLRKWLQAGAPCESPGTAGRGRGALVSVAALRGWRAARTAPAVAESPADALRLVAASFLAFHRDGQHRIIGLRDGEAAAYLHDLWQFAAWQAGVEPKGYAEILELEKIARAETARADERF
jgi:hypothetical protein